MTFKKNQKVVCESGYHYRVESGPWPYRNDGERYLLELLDGPCRSVYSLVDAGHLTLEQPRTNDVGRIRHTGKGEITYHPYSPHTIVYMDEKVVLTRDRLGDYEIWVGSERRELFDNWEAQP